jgi:hypothetical protein
VIKAAAPRNPAPVKTEPPTNAAAGAPDRDRALARKAAAEIAAAVTVPMKARASG